MTTFPPKTLLVAFDFSNPSLAAWRYARALASRLGASLEAVYVAPWALSPDGALLVPALTRDERRALKVRMARALGAQHPVHIAEGDIVHSIIKTAKDRRAGAIVMATHHRSGISRALLGSFAESVVRWSPIPVLTVMRNAKPPKSILAPVNLEPYSMSGFRFAEALARDLKAPLTLFHVSERIFLDAGALKRLEHAVDEARKRYHLKAALKLVGGDPVKRIAAESRRHGLVVLVAHKRGFLRDGLLGTTAERVLRRSGASVLSVPAFAHAVRPSHRRRLPGPLARASEDQPLAW